MAIIFEGAKRALRSVPAGTQSSMYQAHFRTATKRRSVGGSTLRGSVHHIRDANGTVHRLQVISAQRAGSTYPDTLVMNSSDAAAVLQYLRSQGRQNRGW